MWGCVHIHRHTCEASGTHQAVYLCVYTYYVLGLVAQAHPVSLPLRKAVHGARSGGMPWRGSGGGQG